MLMPKRVKFRKQHREAQAARRLFGVGQKGRVGLPELGLMGGLLRWLPVPTNWLSLKIPKSAGAAG